MKGFKSSSRFLAMYWLKGRFDTSRMSGILPEMISVESLVTPAIQSSMVTNSE
jgi:hypothetical protein